MPLNNSQSRVVVEESQLSTNDLEDNECVSKQSCTSSSTEPLGERSTRSQNSTKITSIGYVELHLKIHLNSY